MNSIALLGGTFDPIHNGHLELAHVLAHTFHFNIILFIPCKKNLLKENPPVSPQERVDMIHLAINPFSAYQCDTREIERKTPSYTIETLKSLRQDYPDDALTFTMGIDAFNSLEQWHYFEDFLNYAHLLVFPRPGYLLNLKPEVRAIVTHAKTTNIDNLHKNKHGYLYFAHQPQHPTSSTEIRMLLKNKKSSSLSDYLPQSVIAYIQRKKLY